MTAQQHFIAGLPRSGSTLLAALLRQNPAIHASISSPVGGIFSAMQKAMSGSNEAAAFIDNAQRERMLKSVFIGYYGLAFGTPVLTQAETCEETDWRYEDSVLAGTVFDTNRMWSTKLPILARLFPDCRMICCVRPIPQIIDSIERLVRSNLELSGIFGFEPGGTVYSRAQALMSANGLVGFAMTAMKEAMHGPEAGRMLIVEYEALARHPKATIEAIYDFVGIKPYFAHDFAKIEQIPGAEEFDRKLGTPGLHRVAPQVGWNPRHPALPPDLLAGLSGPFWRSNNPNVPVIHIDQPALKSVA